MAAAAALVTWATAGAAAIATAVEYRHAGFGHYFVTADATEIANLDSGATSGWARTGESFTVYTDASTGATGTCRFFSASFAPKSSHFYTPIAAECAKLQQASSVWTYEGIVFYLRLADAAGSCPQTTRPLYRLYNNGMSGAPNHRYTTRQEVATAMQAQGWIAEGSGPSAVFACVPAASAAGAFTLASPVAADGGALPVDYTCDGTGSTLPLSWSNVPAGTKEFALLMTTVPGDRTIKWNWVLYGVPRATPALAKDAFGVGTPGVGSDGPGTIYNPPCSQGPGTQYYTYALYALSGSPTFNVPASQVTGSDVTDAIAPLTLAVATLRVSATRTTMTGSTPACLDIRNSTRASTTGSASVSCDGTYAYVSSTGIAEHAMMEGITATNLQVPIPQDFIGAKGWKIPLAPAVAASTTSVQDGPIGVAINGVPIFNPCKQGGCQNGDTKVLGELDRCNGHAGRADDYHYHAAPVCMMAGHADPHYWDTHPVAWALDGFAIFGYYDANGSVAVRDSICGGNALPVVNAPAGYSYHLTEASPYVLSCLRGTPSPDLPNQASKYKPLRPPPVTPFRVSAMTLTTDDASGWEVLQFTSAIPFTTTETGSDSYANGPGTYRIRYRQVTGDALAALLAAPQNAGRTTCWDFVFVSASGVATQPQAAYCR